MRITGVRVRRVQGTMRTDGPLWEERLVQPIDIYPDHVSRFDNWGGVQAAPDAFRNAGIALSVAQSPIHTPWQEYLIKWNAIHQHFLATPAVSVNGVIATIDRPGLGMELDPAKIEAEEEIFPA
jgi:hypothetical protein